MLLTIDLRVLLHGPNIALDLTLAIVLLIGCYLVITVVLPSLKWNADDWYNNNNPSGLRTTTLESTRFLDTTNDDTSCSGFSNCAEQESFTTKTHQRAFLELIEGVFGIVAAHV